MGLFALLFAGVIGLDTTVKPGTMENHVAKVVRRELGQVEDVQVRIRFRSAMESLNGEFTHVGLKLRGFKIEEVSLADIASVAPAPPAKPAPRRARRSRGQVRRRPINFPVPLRERRRIDYAEEAVVRSVTLDGTDFTYAGIPIGQLSVTLEDVRYSPRRLIGESKLSVRGLGRGAAVFRVGPEAIRGAIVKMAPDILKPEVKLKDGTLEITGSKTVMMLPLPFSCTAGLEPADGVSLKLVEPEVKLAGAPLPEKMVKGVLEGFGSLFHVPMEALNPLDGKITRVSITPKHIEIHAEVSLPEREDAET